MEGLASRLSFPRIRLHVCITRAIVHALDTFPRINWPRNYEMCRFQRATMGREAKRIERERGGSAFVHIRPSRYDPERIRRIPRIHYARVTPVCVTRVARLRATCHVCSLLLFLLGSSSAERRMGPHSYTHRGPARADPTCTPPDCHFRRASLIFSLPKTSSGGVSSSFSLFTACTRCIQDENGVARGGGRSDMCGVAVSVQSGTKWWRGSRDDVMEVCLALFLDLFLFFLFRFFWTRIWNEDRWYRVLVLRGDGMGEERVFFCRVSFIAMARMSESITSGLTISFCE